MGLKVLPSPCANVENSDNHYNTRLCYKVAGTRMIHQVILMKADDARKVEGRVSHLLKSGYLIAT